jgi:hypothetical protein
MRILGIDRYCPARSWELASMSTKSRLALFLELHPRLALTGHTLMLAVLLLAAVWDIVRQG